MFARTSGAEHPILADPGRQWYVESVDVSTANQLLIRHRSRRPRVGSARLAIADESLGPLHLPAADGHKRPIAGITNRVPVLPRDIRRSQNSKATKPRCHYAKLRFVWSQRCIILRTCHRKGRTFQRKDAKGAK